MYLTYRLARAGDLDTSFDFVQRRLGYQEKLRAEVLAFWGQLLHGGRCIAVVVEDRDQPRGERVVAFRMSVFATDEFFKRAKTVDGPFLHRRVLELWRKKSKFILGPADFAQGAVRGLNVAAVHWGWDTVRYAPEEVVKIKEYLSQSYQTEIAKFRLKEYMEEVYGEEERDRLLSFGLALCRDFRELPEFRKSSKAGPPRPYLLHATLDIRNDPSRNQTVAGRIAALNEPRFRFSGAEQEVLKLAMDGLTDPEIAGEIRLSVAAVKKRWQGVFKRVLDHEPDFFDAVSEEQYEGETKPRRRLLLRVLKQHPEELWPT